MSNIIPLPENGQLPAYLANARKTNFAAFYAGVSAGFPVLSIKGKVFTLVRGGERNLIPDPNEPDEPARALNVVILNVNPHLSKIYYKRGYEEGAAEKPDCYSNDGILPSPEATTPQAKSCAGCAHNVWGTGQNGKGKACSDSRRLAVAPAGDVNDPMLLRVPPASLKPLAEYAALIERRNLPMEAVVTTIRFDPEESTPRLVLKANGLVDEETYQKAIKVADGELVRQIIGFSADDPSAATPPVSSVISDSDVDEALKAAAAPEPKPKAASKAEPEPKPKAASKPKLVASAGDDSLVSAVTDILGDYDD